MAERIIIERTDADELGQQFHVRFVSRNGRRTFWCENLKTRASALKAIVSHAETFVDNGRCRVDTPPATAAAGDLGLFTGRLWVPITEIDSRTKTGV